MKIACVDKTASSRSKLLEYLENAYFSARGHLGFLELAEFYPYSKNEILFGTSYDLIILGPDLSPDEMLTYSHEFKITHNNLVILLLLSKENYCLKNLRKLNPVAKEIFFIEENAIRIINAICKIKDDLANSSLGEIIVLNSVKGGVGTTSIATGLAHASCALNKNSLLVDFSTSASLLHYLQCPLKHSLEYTTALQNTELINPCDLEKIICSTKNGIDLLLPPAGSKEIRELWLRGENTFEITLDLLEMLRQKYSCIIIDLASTEGILPFALNIKSNQQLIVTSNEPASIYLLQNKIEELINLPSKQNIKIIINHSREQALSYTDIYNFVSLNYVDIIEELSFCNIYYDKKAAYWIGTGNSFYTEGSRSLQKSLENILDDSKFKKHETKEISAKISWLQKLCSLFNTNDNFFYPKEKHQPREIPWQTSENKHTLNPTSNVLANSRANISLEFLLLLIGAIILTTSTLPTFIEVNKFYFSRFNELINN